FGRKKLAYIFDDDDCCYRAEHLFYLVKPQSIGIIAIAIAIILSSLFYIGLGTLLGLYSKSVMEAPVLVLPVIVVFSFGTFIVAWTDQYPILKIANYLPNIQLLEIAKKEEGKLWFADMLVHLGIIFACVFAISVVTVAIYRKRRLD